MTRITRRKSRLTFETEETTRYRGKLREIIVEVAPTGYGLSLRLKGTRLRYDASWAGVFHHAADNYVRRQKAERALKRKKL